MVKLVSYGLSKFLNKFLEIMRSYLLIIENRVYDTNGFMVITTSSTFRSNNVEGTVFVMYIFVTYSRNNLFWTTGQLLWKLCSFYIEC